MSLSNIPNNNKYNHSIQYLNDHLGEVKNLRNPLYKLNFSHESDFFPKFIKTNFLRKLLSKNSTSSWIDELPNWLFIATCIFIIIIGILFIKYLYRQWRLRNIDEEEQENNELSDRAQAEFENNFLNARTFSFIPISSPIKLKASLTPKSEDNSTEDSKSDEIEIKEPSNLKIINISSFCITIPEEKKEVPKI